MAHEITERDGLVLTGQKAWHGMGLLVEEAPTPREALTLANLDWGVEQRSIISQTVVPDPARPGKKKVVDIPLPGFLANYRIDDSGGQFLGLVSDSYEPIQNYQVADFCEALASTNEKVKVETAGSIRGGQKVWFLLRAGSFEIGKGDENIDYLLISNGFDGLTPYRFTPTNIRVVCSNTLHMVTGRDDSYENLGNSALVLRHTPGINERVEEARQALKHYEKVRESNIKTIQGLAAKSASSDEFKQFFLECYTTDFGEIPTESDIKAAEDAKEKARLLRAIERSKSAYLSFSKRFDDEHELVGASWWNAFNAYSGLVQHDRKARGKDDVDRVNKRVNSNLFGLNQDRTQKAFILACKKGLA